MIDNPRLGFGCASLGSRISSRKGLAALSRAYDAGICWFDVAPSYGDGHAEKLLGRFLAGRAGVMICTKVGILPPPSSLTKQVLRPMARGLLAIAPGTRSAIRRHRPAAIKPPLTAAMIGNSVDSSLSRLGVERIDILALHEAKVEEVGREEILRALEAVVAAGKVDRVSIAASPKAVRAALAASPIYSVIQVANNPLEPNLALLKPDIEGRKVEAVTHSVFGADGMIEEIARRIASSPDLGRAFAEAGYEGAPKTQALAYLPDFAFSANRTGVVLLSMFADQHLKANIDRHNRARDITKIHDLALLCGSTNVNV